MPQLTVFVIRAVVGLGFAVLLIRFFYPQAGVPHILGLAIFMIGMAYITEAWRHRKKNG